MSDTSEDKGLMIFGHDVSKMPCFRNSYLYGISAGLGAGLVCFMFTSRTKWACHTGMGIFTVVTLSYWTQCRYKYSQAKFEMLRLQELMQRHSIYEGTEAEKQIDLQQVSKKS